MDCLTHYDTVLVVCDMFFRCRTYGWHEFSAASFVYPGRACVGAYSLHNCSYNVEEQASDQLNGLSSQDFCSPSLALATAWRGSRLQEQATSGLREALGRTPLELRQCDGIENPRKYTILIVFFYSMSI